MKIVRLNDLFIDVIIDRDCIIVVLISFELFLTLVRYRLTLKYLFGIATVVGLVDESTDFIFLNLFGNLDSLTLYEMY